MAFVTKPLFLLGLHVLALFGFVAGLNAESALFVTIFSEPALPRPSDAEIISVSPVFATEIILNQAGLDSGVVSTKNAFVSDIFNRPSVILTVVINGLLPNQVSPQTTPFMSKFYSSNSESHKKLYVSVAPANADCGAFCDFEDILAFFALKSFIPSVFPNSFIQTYFDISSANSFFTSKLNNKNTNSNSPDFIFLSLNFKSSDCFDSSSKIDSLSSLDKELETFISFLNSNFMNKVAVNLVFKPMSTLTETKPIKKSPASNQRYLADDNSTVISDSEQIEFILLIWANLVLIFILLFVFCCVSWESELDPILYSTFREESK